MAEEKFSCEDFLNDLKKSLEADKQKTEINSLLLGIGSLAEISGITMKAFVQNGFTREEAMEVVKTMIFSTFQNMLGPK